jgi:hypothetical protein
MIRMHHRNTKEDRLCGVIRDQYASKNDQSLTWITGKNLKHKISHVSLEQLERVGNPTSNEQRQPSVVLHSFDHGDRPATTLPDNIRTGTTLLQEAIFQLLQRDPKLLQQSNSIKEIISQQGYLSSQREIGLEVLTQVMRELLDSVGQTFSNVQGDGVQTDTKARSPVSILWIIDRIDTCQFKSKRSTRRDTKRQDIPTLDSFAVSLEKLTLKPRSKSRHTDTEHSQSYNLYTLITSLYDPKTMDDDWLDTVDDECHHVDENGKRKEIWTIIEV